ncbi:hypothetical protein HNQ41_000057 [Texcoconibacillus texcoconensis]|uniref:Uncharacterized protein n=1 Tax=Texcoconibacillus texcoconensis TaxID=1095777 RepID=A0A840QKL4_9BACI|nr:hypothetical protein [Texcoconibacillus texcoconensis]
MVGVPLITGKQMGVYERFPEVSRLFGDSTPMGEGNKTFILPQRKI